MANGDPVSRKRFRTTVDLVRDAQFAVWLCPIVLQPRCIHWILPDVGGIAASIEIRGAVLAHEDGLALLHGTDHPTMTVDDRPELFNTLFIGSDRDRLDNVSVTLHLRHVLSPSNDEAESV